MAFRLNEELIYTGKVEGISKKTDKPYTILNYLDDTGQVFGTMVSCEVPKNLKQLDKVEVVMELQVGRFTSLKTIEIKKVD
ncbi:MAG: hypothetical protein RBR71_13855 [Gudongella sp.]|nr:hypothetical protein [Gudongella sp.]